MDWTTKTTGSYPIEATVRVIGDDLLIAVWGGSRPHIGAVAIAQPRPSLRNPGQTSATASVYTVIGHKEDIVTRMMAIRIASALNRMVVVTAGIHWDDLPSDATGKIVEECEMLAQKIINEARERIETKLTEL